jgi:cytochrome c oxidase accessory protein FixG
VSAPLQPNLDAVTTINQDGSRNFIHPADVRGRFTTLRALAGTGLIAVYILLPWIPVNGYPAVFFDFAHRQLHLFGLTFLPQDFWLAFFAITGAGFALFYVSALWGRVWCGWACPQTVFIEQVFRRIERLIEGDAQKRRALDRSPWTTEKLVRRGIKFSLFFLVAFVIAHVFLSYFISIQDLYHMMLGSPLENWSVFLFVFALTGVLLFDFVWFREQFCIVMCPYGRLQSVLIDNDSVVIGYDAKRGEPRGKVSAPGAGDCIDCHRCVTVCPTGIDIRQGLQIECIGCSNCVDACDEIMDRVNRPRGLVRYASMNALEGKKTRFLRPRTILYTLLMLLGAVVMGFSLSTFKPATVTLVRMTGAPYYLLGGNVRNQYLLRVFNKRTHPVTFTLRVANAPAAMSASGIEQPVTVEPLGEQKIMLVVEMPQPNYSGPFRFDVETTAENFKARQTIPFLGPAL